VAFNAGLVKRSKVGFGVGKNVGKGMGNVRHPSPTFA
jgi:hypothetical protein